MKRVIFALGMLLLLNFVHAQTKWIIKDSVIRFPSNFGSWIQRHVGKYNPYSDPIGTRVPSFQLKEIGDFNKDGYNDICMELALGLFDTNNTANPRKYQDSLMNYYKGIFINQKNGTYLLDTNYIIHGRGAPWYGGFGDFNGDGLIDYYSNCYAYEFDPKNQDTLFYKYSNRNYSPSHVYFNNGKSFDRLDLDTVYMMSGNSDIVDINKDGIDEIVSLPASKFIVYQYDSVNKSFNKKFNNVNDFITKRYGNTIKIFNFYEKIDNSILLTVLRNYTDPIENHVIDILKINLSDSSITIANSFKHPTYMLNDGSLSSATIADSKGVFKYEDINNDKNNELILLGSYTFNNALSIFQSNERMGINIIENNQVNTQKYWNYDTTEIGFRIGGNINDLNNDKISEIISAEWIPDSSKKYFSYYYSLDSGVYKKKYIETANKNIVPKNIYDKYHVWVDNFNKITSSNSQIIIYDPNSLSTNYMYYSFDCKDIVIKPTFNTNRTSFVTGDSLKLTISNANKGDTLKWYYGTKSDLTNVSSKTFTDSTKLFVTRTDSLGCLISSDTIKITTYPKLQITTKLRTFKYNLNSYKDAAPNIFLKMHQTITQTVLYSVNGVEHIVTIPVDSVPNAPIHFINKTGNWEVEKFYPNFKMDGARNYSFIDTLGNFAYANTGSEVPRPWPLGDLVVVNTINDTLKWTKVDSVKAFYHSVGTGDLNGDGLSDVVGLHMQSNYWSDNLHPFLQNKNGTYSEGRNVISSDVGAHRNSSGAVLVADVLGDSKPEIIRGSYGFTGANGETRYAFEILGYDKQTNQYIKVYEPKKLGVFTDIVNGGQGATSIKSADFDHNGFQDLVICSEGNLPNSNTKGASMIQIWLNNGKGEFIPDQYIINNADDSLNIREFEVADVDNDGWLDIVMHGIGGPLYRQPVLSSKYGYYFQINNLIWKNNSGVFDIIPNQLNVYDPSNIELIGNSNFLKGFMVNGKLKFIGFECADAINPTKLYEITVNFCNNLIKPAFSSSKYSFCTGDSLKLTVSNINKGDTLKWYYGSKSDLTNLSNKTFTDSTKLFVTRTDSSGCVISSDTVQIKKYSIPTAPTLVRDADNNLVSGASGTTWYKDGVAITDTTQKYKPAAAGSYTAKTTTNGCTSALSAAYYYLVTDIINLSKDEYIKLAPNPFVNQLNFDFVVKGYQKLNIEVFDIATGTKVASQLNVTAGSRIALGQLSGGTYIIRVTSNDQKIVQQFKVVKM